MLIASQTNWIKISSFRFWRLKRLLLSPIPSVRKERDVFDVTESGERIHCTCPDCRFTNET